MLRYTIATGKTETDIQTEYGVHVSGSKGLIGRPGFKNPTKKYDWDYLNGEWVDMRYRRYKAREITLSCWLSGTSELNAVSKMNDFLKAFQTQGLVRLRVRFVHDGNSQPVTPVTNDSLFYLVYLSNPGEIKYKWKAGKNILKFDLTLTEPSPVKRVYDLAGTDSGTVTVAFSSASEFDIHWGDGGVDADNCGSNQSVKHEYTSAGRHFLIVTGVISDISEMAVTVSTPEITVIRIFDEI